MGNDVTKYFVEHFSSYGAFLIGQNRQFYDILKVHLALLDIRLTWIVTGTPSVEAHSSTVIYVYFYLLILQSVVLLLLTRAGTKSSRQSRYEDYQNGAAESHRVNSSRRKANERRKRSCRHALSIRFTKSSNRNNSDESSSYKQNSISQNMNYKGNYLVKFEI